MRKKMQLQRHMSLWVCEARHDHPACPPENFFFPKGKVNEILEGGHNNARAWEEYAIQRAHDFSMHGVKKIDLYVTGHGCALISAIKALHHDKVEVQLYHYDDDSGQYFRQDPYKMEYYGGNFYIPKRPKGVS